MTPIFLPPTHALPNARLLCIGELAVFLPGYSTPDHARVIVEEGDTHEAAIERIITDACRDPAINRLRASAAEIVWTWDGDARQGKEVAGARWWYLPVKVMAVVGKGGGQAVRRQRFAPG